MRALIIGAGVGGLTAATGLQRRGIEAVVYEREEDVRRFQLGAGLTLAFNATRALDQLGLLDGVRAAGIPYEEQEFRTSAGRLLARWSVSGADLQVGVRRADLHAVLIGGLADGTLRAGVEYTGFEEDAGGVTAHFADGSTDRGDVLIGADGLNGPLRGQLDVPGPARYAGYKVWRALVDFEDERAPTGMFRMLWGDGKRAAFYHVAPGTIYWFNVANAAAGSRDPKGRRRELLLDRFSGWFEPTEALISATDESAIHETDVYDRKPADRWGRGRVTLLGDAAHPMTFNLGQGACQAIEDAVVLAASLSRAESDPAAGLREYEAKRRARTAQMTKLSWRIGAAGRWSNPVARSARDLALRVGFQRFAVPSQERFLTAELT